MKYGSTVISVVITVNQLKRSNRNELKSILLEKGENMQLTRRLLAVEQLFTKGEQTYSDSFSAKETGDHH